MAVAAPHRERRAALSSALSDSDRAEGTAWSCVRGGAAGGEGKGLHRRVVGMEQPAQGSGHSPELLELRECLDSALRRWVWVLGGLVWSWWELELILVGSLPTWDIL